MDPEIPQPDFPPGETIEAPADIDEADRQVAEVDAENENG